MTNSHPKVIARDISLNAVTVGRILDRLPAGNYIFTIEKSGDGMNLRVEKSETLIVKVVPL